jgi:hypothetical protein
MIRASRDAEPVTVRRRAATLPSVRQTLDSHEDAI